jgi:hypothetical protein
MWYLPWCRAGSSKHLLVSLKLRQGIPTTVAFASRLGFPLWRKTLQCARSGEDAQRLTEYLVTHATHRATECRAGANAFCHPNVWPMRAFPSSFFNWKVMLTYPCGGSHINVLEMLAAFSSIKWRCRHPELLAQRFAHLLDSQVCVSALAKGRSSAPNLLYVQRRLNALLLAASLSLIAAYVGTADNPADTPSRWHEKHKH